MDILPEPDDAIPAILVPVAQKIHQYDNKDFRSFGSRHGFSSETASAMPPEEIARRLQSWLFFGLLSEALASHFNVEDFIHVPGKDLSSRYLSLRNLPTQLSNVGAEVETDRIRDYCFFAADFVSDMEVAHLLDASPASETALVVLVLARALLTLTNVEGLSPNADTTFPWDSSFLRRRMREGGWCPQQTVYIVNTCDPLVACFLARLRRPDMLTHTRCTDTACVANNVFLDDNYHQRHVVDGCPCETVAVDAESLRQIILRGGIPLVSVACQEDGRVALELTEATENSTYTALSHVWSDGLGNPFANAAPRCQLEMISHCLSQPRRGSDSRITGMLCGVHVQHVAESPVSRPVGIGSEKPPLFWLDTLCIPVAAPDDPPGVAAEIREVKTLAINQMAQIYATASEVLVLDSELQQVKADTSNPLHDVEILARLVCCSWMRRSWTLQEGAMARNLVLRCRNGIVTPLLPLQNKRKEIKIVPGPIMYVNFWKALKRYIGGGIPWFFYRDAARGEPIITHLRFRLQEVLSHGSDLLQRGNKGDRIFGQATPESQIKQLCSVWNNLAYRNSTMREDLPAIFANLLDLSAYQILQLRPQDRMLAVLRSLKIVPVDLLFNTGPRASSVLDSRMRWVPTEPSRMRMLESKEHFTGWDLSSIGDIGLDKAMESDCSGRLRWTAAGHLELMSTRRNGLSLLVFKTNDLRGMGAESFVTYLGSEDGQETVPLLVHLHRSDADALRRDTFEGALLLDLRLYTDAHKRRRRAKGCLLEMTDGEENKLGFRCRYDCPLSFEEPAKEDFEKYPVVVPKRRLHDFSLTIECDSTEDIPTAKQRPHYENINAVADAVLLVLALPGGLAYMASVIIRVILEVRRGWSSLSSLGRAATIVFALEAGNVTAHIVPPTLAQALFIADRVREAGSLSQLDKAYVILSLLGNPWLLIGFVWLARKAVSRWSYGTWRESFDPEWPASAGRGWRVYSALLALWATFQAWHEGRVSSSMA